MRVEGEGLLLRPFEPADAQVVVEQFGDPAATRFIASPTPDPYTLADAQRWIAGHAEQEAAGSMITRAVAAAGRTVGCVELRDEQPGRPGQAEIGYWTLVSQQRRGVATRATRLLAQWAFQHGFARLYLTAHPGNGASQRVALGAAFRREGVLRAAIETPRGHEDRVLYARLVHRPGRTDPAGAAGPAGTVGRRRGGRSAAAGAGRRVGAGRADRPGVPALAARLGDPAAGPDRGTPIDRRRRRRVARRGGRRSARSSSQPRGTGSDRSRCG